MSEQKTVTIPVVKDVEVHARKHPSLEDTWEILDSNDEVVDTVDAQTEDEALEAAAANAQDYLKDDAKHWW